MGDIISCEVRISRTAAVLFEPQAPSQKVDFNNAGSKATSGSAGKLWSPGYKQQTMGNIRIMPHWRHINKRGFVGVAPAKPGLYLVNPMRIVKHSIRRWA